MLIKAQWVAYFESFGSDTEKQLSLRNVLRKQSNNTRAGAQSMYPNCVDCNRTDKVYTRGQLPSVSTHCQNSNLLTGM